MWTFIPQRPRLQASFNSRQNAIFDGMFAPVGTPTAVVQKLNAEIGKALANPEPAKRFGDMGLEATHSTSEAFCKFLQSEIARWCEVLAKNT